jgi:uncharacterized protein YecE (DUF72 family)
VAPVHFGTSGFAYPEWKPLFYPAGLPSHGFLGHYAQRLTAVEIDATFYRMPKPGTLDAWRNATAEAFRFALKAPRRITHQQRLSLPSSALEYWLGLLPRLGDRLGVVLYQLPPYWRRSDERLAEFLAVLPQQVPSAFEFRHASWFDPAVYALLRNHDAALCIRDDDQGTTPIELTALRTYVRLRRSGYGDAERRSWQKRLAAWAEQGIEVYAFLKHEDNPQAALLAVEFAHGIAV